MKINFKKLITLEVVTKSGDSLGRVKEVEIDADNLKITALIVAPAQLPKMLLASELYINSSFIISIDETEIIVEDSFAAEGEKLSVA